MSPSLLAWLGVVVIALVGSVRGESISWFSDPGETHLDSAGSAMDASYTFELGVFSDGFVPTLSNRANWLDHWTVAQSTSYSAVDSNFNALHAVVGNAAPFGVGAEAWIFGHRDGVTGSEWVLFRHPSWTWPTPNPLNPFPIEWNASAATVVLAGEIDGDGMPYLMRSESIQDFDQWKVAALSGELLDGADDDPDEDGAENVVEFLVGSDPLDGASVPSSIPSIVGEGSGFLEVEFGLLTGRLAVWEVEVGSDLVGWETGDEHLDVSFGGAGILARDQTSRSEADRRFMRLRVVLP